METCQASVTGLQVCLPLRWLRPTREERWGAQGSSGACRTACCGEHQLGLAGVVAVGSPAVPGRAAGTPCLTSPKDAAAACRGASASWHTEAGGCCRHPARDSAAQLEGHLLSKPQCSTNDVPYAPNSL